MCVRWGSSPNKAEGAMKAIPGSMALYHVSSRRKNKEGLAALSLAGKHVVGETMEEWKDGRMEGWKVGRL